MPIDWLRRKSNGAVAMAMGVAVAAGLSTGAWLNLPDYLSQPAFKAEPQMILADDPGRAKWKEVISSMGGLGATFVIPAALYSRSGGDDYVVEDDEHELQAILAEVDAEMAAAEQQRALVWSSDWGWSRRHEEEMARREWLGRQAEAARAYAYAAPAYGPYDYDPRYEQPSAAARGYDPGHGAPPPRYEPRGYARYERPPAYGRVVDAEPWAEAGPVPPPAPRPAAGW
jgi:hypothetical protein